MEKLKSFVQRKEAARPPVEPPATSNEKAEPITKQRSNGSPILGNGSDEVAPAAVVLKLQRWNKPRGNIGRVMAAFFSFTMSGLNDAAFGALLPYVRCQPLSTTLPTLISTRFNHITIYPTQSSRSSSSLLLQATPLQPSLMQPFMFAWGRGVSPSSRLFAISSTMSSSVCTRRLQLLSLLVSWADSETVCSTQPGAPGQGAWRRRTLSEDSFIPCTPLVLP